MKKDFNGTLTTLLIGQAVNSLLTERVPSVEAQFDGLQGEKHSGITRLSDSRTPFYERGTLIRNDRQISIVSEEELAEVAAALGLERILPEWLGANLVIRGIPDLTRLPPTTRLFFAEGVVISITAENHPCKGPGRVIQEHYPQEADLVQRFIKAAQHKRGLVAVVERPGLLTCSEELSALVPPQYRYAAAENQVSPL